MSPIALTLRIPALRTPRTLVRFSIRGQRFTGRTGIGGGRSLRWCGLYPRGISVIPWCDMSWPSAEQHVGTFRRK
jgi:hypothetical protein